MRSEDMAKAIRWLVYASLVVFLVLIMVGFLKGFVPGLAVKSISAGQGAGVFLAGAGYLLSTLGK